jgi:hypothetical protein
MHQLSLAVLIGLAVLLLGASASRGTTACIRTHVDLGLGAPSSLKAVAALGPNDVWAVGTRGKGAGRPLVEHYDGHRWLQVGAGPLSRGGLWDVEAISPHDVWAAGTTDAVFGHPAVIHWNGKRWSRVPLPKVLYGSADALSVAGRDVWLLASDDNGLTVPLRWTGHRWQILRAGIPRRYATDPGGFAGGNDIAMASKHDGWIVGGGEDATGVDHGFVTRWNGRRWKTIRVPSAVLGDPSERGGGEEVLGVASANPRNVWAIASAVSSGFTGWYTLHWDGARWRLARNPGGAAVQWSGLNLYEIAIDVTRQGEAWLVAGDDIALRKNAAEDWSSVPDPIRNVELQAVSASGPGSAWAVGGRLTSGYEEAAVVERIDCPT